MAKNEVKAEMMKLSASVDAMLAQAKQFEGLSTSEQFKKLVELAGGDSMADIQVIIAGKLPFWPALAGAAVVGTIQNVQDVETKFGSVGVYTLVTDKPCLAGNSDGEMLELKAGEPITVLERTVLKNLRNSVGKKVVIMCTGKSHSKNGFDYYDYRAAELKPRTPELKAANG